MLSTPVAVLVVVVLVIAAIDLLNNRYLRSGYVLTTLVGIALLLALFKLAGLSWDEAGLGTDTVASGVRWGLVLIAVVALGYLVAALLPVTRPAFLDRRVSGKGPGDVAYDVLVRIPLFTVVLEEIAFRGVLYGLLNHLFGAGWATVASSVLYGLWHVLSAGTLTRENPVAGRMFQSRPVLAVVATVVVTTLFGVVLCEVRRRSGSLLAPIALHWAVNALGLLTAYLVTRRRDA